MSELDDLKKEAVERIYLIPDRDEGRLRYVWCDDPSPEYGMRDDDAVEYVRRDKYDALAAQVERLRKRIAASKAQAARLMAERDALAAHVERLEPALEDFARGQGICCCGDDVASHTINDGHSPVDSGWYALAQYMGDAPTTSLAHIKADAAAEALEALSRAKGPNGSPPEGDSFTDGWDAAFESVDSEAARYRRQAEEGDAHD